MNPWENDPYELPILADATYRCSCGCAANNAIELWRHCPNCGARIEKGKDNGMGQE